MDTCLVGAATIKAGKKGKVNTVALGILLKISKWWDNELDGKVIYNNASIYSIFGLSLCSLFT